MLGAGSRPCSPFLPMTSFDFGFPMIQQHMATALALERAAFAVISSAAEICLTC